MIERPRPPEGDDRGRNLDSPPAVDSEEIVDLGGDSGFLAAIPDPEGAGTVGSTHTADEVSALEIPSAPAPTRTRRPVPSPIDSPSRRDRIVILGRRASGKTVFLSRLYHHLFHAREGISLQALDGPSHLRCIQTMAELTRGQWPPATGETTAIDLEVRFPGGHERLVALDYPGELFRRAFVDEVGGPDTEALLEHVDRAAAVLMLMDPAMALAGKPEEFAEDDFGMIQALRRIRASPRGDAVPVAIVLTKVDANERVLRAAGGLKAFVERYYPALVRAANGVRVFGCSAVRTAIDPMGRRLPQVRTEPIGLVEPLTWCLTAMGRLRRDELSETRRRETEKQQREALRAMSELARRERRVLIVIWSAVAVFVLVGGFIAWWVLS